MWTFSSASNFYKDSKFDEECRDAFEYIYQYFKDAEHGGVFWELDYLGRPTKKKKQIYGQAFCIYALTEYYKYSKNAKAILWANEIYELLELKAYDQLHGGYVEALDMYWRPVKDMRLSDKDLNAPKSANTLLHILEAYTTLYEVTRSERVGNSLIELIQLFLNKIIGYNGHLKLFFTEDWKSISQEISFGHDIETAWLLVHAARTLSNHELIEKTEETAINIAKRFIHEALDKDFGVINAKFGDQGTLDMDKYWWPQAEAMVGLVYVWEITGDNSYLNIAMQIWEFVQSTILDIKKGEWYFRVNREGIPTTTENKVGPWKCPYHNSRAMMEILRILESS